jgi:hypothetical protein
MLATPRLREAIDGLYRVFQRYELRSDLDPCPCCHASPQQWEQLNDWLRLPEVHQKLTSAIERWSDSPFVSELIEAAVLLP